MRKKRSIATATVLVAAGVLISACSNTANGHQRTLASTTTSNGKSPVPSSTTVIAKSAPSQLRARYNLCTSQAINALIEKELDISPGNLQCFNDPSSGDITNAQWGDATLQNSQGPTPFVGVTFGNNNNPEGSSDQFAADLNLESQSSSQGPPLYMSLPPKIVGLAVIWRGGTTSLEVKDGNYIIRVGVSDPANESLSQQISTKLVPLIVDVAFR